DGRELAWQTHVLLAETADEELAPDDPGEIAAARWGTLDELAGPAPRAPAGDRTRTVALPRRAARRGPFGPDPGTLGVRPLEAPARSALARAPTNTASAGWTPRRSHASR